MVSLRSRPNSVGKWIGTVVVVLTTASGSPALADPATFQHFSFDQGLTSTGACMLHAPGGFMVVCTQHGIFSYDGHRFENLGPQQGLRQGGFVFGLLATDTGHLALNYPDAIMVSEHPIDIEHPPASVKIRRSPDAVLFLLPQATSDRELEGRHRGSFGGRHLLCPDLRPRRLAGTQGAV